MGSGFRTQWYLPVVGFSDLIDEWEVARMTNRSIHSVRKWRSMGRGPRYLKINGYWVKYRREDVEKWTWAHERDITRVSTRDQRFNNYGRDVYTDG